MHFQKRLDERLWFALNEGPQVWIEVPEELDTRGLIVIHDGHKWRGEELVGLGFYEVRFRLRGDADVPTSQHPMSTRSQRAAVAAKKTADPAPVPLLNVDSLKITPPAKSPPVVGQPAPKKRSTLEPDPTTPIIFGDSMVAPPVDSKFIRAIAPQSKTAAHRSLSAVVLGSAARKRGDGKHDSFFRSRCDW
jgi:hypothetical protein